MRTFDDIIPPSRRKDAAAPSVQRPRDSGGARGGFPFITIIVVLLIIAACVAALFYFSGARIRVTPTTDAISVQGQFSASKDTGDLPFKLITAQKLATQPVAGTGTQSVSASAAGELTVYNASGAAVTLVTGTRFQTSGGLIYKIQGAISVPAGSAAQPGTKTATVYAASPGETYNIGPSQFTLPGLAGSALASAVYARSSSPMTGGASGNVPVADPATEAGARAAMIAQLGPALQSSLSSQIPQGYVLLAGAATTTYASVPSAADATTTGMVDVKEEGAITAVVFPEAALAHAVAAAASSTAYEGDVTFEDPSTLALAPASGFPDDSTQLFTFSLSGPVTLLYTVDPNRIAAAVAGKTRSAAEVALTSYPEVKQAVLILRPFWRNSFPADPSAIKVEVLAP